MNVGEVLAHILIVLVAAKLAAEVAERIGVPAVVAEILAGIVVGPSMLGWVGRTDDVLRMLGELGVLLLLLDVGLEMDLAELGAVGRASLAVAVVGVAIPFAAGDVVSTALGHGSNTGLFVGAALTATSVGITARVFGDLRALTTVEARTVLGAAVADDVLGLVILTVVVRLVEEGSVSILSVLGIVGIAIGFLAASAVIGTRLAPVMVQLVHRYARGQGTLVALAFAFTLALAKLAEAAGLAPIVGAFVAGVALSRSNQVDRIRRELTPVGHLFIPVFFLQIGIDADVKAMLRPSVLALAAALFAVAVIGKLLASVGAFGSPGDKLLIGIGMLPRGEVGLIFAGIGLRNGILKGDLYAALLLVILATTLVTPSLLRARLRAIQKKLGSIEFVLPEDGEWMTLDDDVVNIHGSPPPDVGLHLALRAARELARARPGESLLAMCANLVRQPLSWDATATGDLLELLRHGSPRSWRFLEATGVLDVALPELAEAIRHRRGDPGELDPAGMLRWTLVDEVARLSENRELGPVLAKLEKPEWLVLAALILDASDADGASDAVGLARALVRRLDLGKEAEQEVALLVGESGLMRAAAFRVDGLDEPGVLYLATHLERPERARALYLLSIARGGLDPIVRSRLRELYGRIQAALARPELTGERTRTILDERLAELLSLGPLPNIYDRVAKGPRAWQLSHPATALLRQATLIEPLPRRGVVRVRVWNDGDSHTVDVAGRDQHGFLAAVTGVLAARSIDVVSASVATWPDGGVIESFAVRAASPLPVEFLEQEIGRALRAAPVHPPLDRVSIRFDDAASPWATLCDVEATDRPGLLHGLAATFAACGVNVHSAAITSDGTLAKDRFEVTTRRGDKLDDATKERLRLAFAGEDVASGGRRRR